jgi:hypothetical protein
MSAPSGTLLHLMSYESNFSLSMLMDAIHLHLHRIESQSRPIHVVTRIMEILRKCGLQDLILICMFASYRSSSFHHLLMILCSRGGGNTENLSLSQFGPALRWMLHEALDHGLRMTLRQRDWKPFKPHYSMNPLYRALEYLPLTRLSYNQSPASSETHSW